MRFVGSTLRVLVTLAAVAVSAVLVLMLWRAYMLAPWTRDGRVQAQVVNVASEVAGTVVEVKVHDNQFVRQGDVLFQVDRARFQLAVAQAQASIASAQNQLELAQSEARRQRDLRVYASEEAREKADTNADVAEATLNGARVALSTAQLNLARSTIVSPVNGFVTHLRLQPGNYVNTGVAQVAIINSDSFWIDGYFEETKLHTIQPGQPARVRLMGYETPLTGTVGSIGRGISDANDAANGRGLPTVNPIFTWVRLAQRIPIRIEIKEVPPDITLVIGMTASISVGEEAEAGPGLGRQFTNWVRDHL